MVPLSQSPWISPIHITKTLVSNPSPFFLTSKKLCSFKTRKISLFAVSDDSSVPNLSEETDETKPNPVKLAFESAIEYKKSRNLVEVQENGEHPVGKTTEIDRFQEIYGDPVAESVENVNGGNIGKSENLQGNGDDAKEEIPDAVRIALEKAKEYEKNKVSVESGTNNAYVEVSPEYRDDGNETPNAVRIAMKKAKEYKENMGKMRDDGNNEGSKRPPGDVEDGMEEASKSQIAIENAKEYEKDKRTKIDNNSNLESLNLSSSLGNEGAEKNNGKQDELKMSSMDFVGLDFGDKKKSRGLPAGLVPLTDFFPEGDLPEVEILVGDASKFGKTTPSETKPTPEESADLYKPKVSTWGLFPRPNDISKAFGGGRTIRPGEALEAPEDRVAKEARTKQLVAAYKKKFGLNMDPKVKEECEKALKDGNSLMDVGRLKEALPYYQEVMDKLAFQTELHGLAALQWSICQDSLIRSEQARSVYEKLQSHPNAQVSKKAKQFVFSFQAMEMLRVRRSEVPPKNTGYQEYFEAFVEEHKEGYTTAEKEDASEDGIGSLTQAFPYIIFLASPVLLILLIIATKRI